MQQKGRKGIELTRQKMYEDTNNFVKRIEN